MDKFRSVIQTEFRQFEEAFAAILQSDNPLLNEVLDYVYAKRGKLFLKMRIFILDKISVVSEAHRMPQFFRYERHKRV